jgi:Spy/CpxP family protein refolding chaperone
MMQMRKTFTALGLGLALTMGSPAYAQGGQGGAQVEKARGAWQKGEKGRKGHGLRMLFRGITLTDAQRAQLKALHEQNKPKMEADRELMKKAFDEAKALRDRGDTAAARSRVQALHKQRMEAHQRHAAAVRGILTADQQKVFDANLAKMKERRAKHEGGREGRRGDRPARSEGLR